MSAIRFGELLTQVIRMIAARDQQNISVIETELGRSVGRTRSTIQHWRKGNRPPTPEMLERLTQALVQRAAFSPEKAARLSGIWRPSRPGGFRARVMYAPARAIPHPARAIPRPAARAISHPACTAARVAACPDAVLAPGPAAMAARLAARDLVAVGRRWGNMHWAAFVADAPVYAGPTRSGVVSGKWGGRGRLEFRAGR